MQTLARLFGRSPFAPLQTHMIKVANCVKKIIPLFEAFEKEDTSLIESLSQEISELEHEADLTKNDIRNHLPKGLFLPVDRGSLLEMLSVQDLIADVCETTAVLLTLRKMQIQSFFKDDFKSFLNKNLETFYGVQKIIQELDELLESSFGGVEAEKVRIMVEDVAYKEHEAELLQRRLMKNLFRHADDMPYPDFHLWMKIFEQLGSLSHLSEKLANRVRMTLELK